MNRLENLLFRYFQYLDSKGRTFNAVLGLICTAGIGAFDLYAPDEATHSYLYILPIAFVTWFSGLRHGIAILLVCTALWAGNNVVDSFLISSWNVISTLLFFAAIATLLHKTRNMWEHEKMLSRTDLLTGAINLRAFSELVNYEILRSKREGLPFSLAYLDLDNFKYVNDTYGHAAGDELLKSTVSTLVIHLRKTDVVGRLGGDEFIIFLPATDQASVKIVMQKIKNELFKHTSHDNRSTTFSMGVVTCREGTADFDSLVAQADVLMYEAKRAGKNNIRYEVYPPMDSF
jgi:diguanylate cyclase (GGDEF)-like protein